MTINGNLKINDLRDLLPILRKRKWLIILPWVIISTITIVGTFLVKPTYQASALLQLNKQVKLSSDLQGLLGIGRDVYISEEQRIQELRSYYNELTSSWYIAQLIDSLRLDEDPEIDKVTRQASVRQPDVPLEQLRVNFIQNELKSNLGVNYAGENQIMISVESPDPRRARDEANTLGNIFVKEKLRQELTSIRSSQDFSDIQLQKYEKLLADKIAEKTEFERNRLRNQLDVIIMSDSNRVQIQTEIDKTQTDVNDGQSEERDLLVRLNGVEGLSVANLKLRESEELRRAKSDLKELMRSVAELMTKYTWSDPQILNNRLKQNVLLNSVEVEIRRLTSEQFATVGNDTRSLLADLFAVRANLDFYYSKLNFLKVTLDEIKDQVNRIPEYQAITERLNREIQSATDLRDKFRKQQEGTTISQALIQDVSLAKYRIVEPAKIPMVPVKPDRVKGIFIGIILGMVVGCAVAVVAELLDSSFKKVEDLERFIGLPVLGVTPRIEFLSKFKKQIA